MYLKKNCNYGLRMVLNFLYLHIHKNTVGRFYRDHHTLSNRTDKLSSRQRPHNPEPCLIRAIAPTTKFYI